jgi:hypothetical protein
LREPHGDYFSLPRDPAPDAKVPVAVPYWGRHLVEWNDEPRRTAEEAIAAFKEAAALASQLRRQAIADDIRL